MSDLVARLRKIRGFCQRHEILPADSKTFEEAASEIERLRATLHRIIELDHHNHGPPLTSTKIAREALNQQFPQKER